MVVGSTPMELWELTARERIRDSLATYNWSGDAYRLEELAETFCEDGELEIRGRDPLQGREAIVGFLGRHTEQGDDESRRAALAAASAARGVRRIVRHTLTNVRFLELVPDQARGRVLLHRVHRGRPRPLWALSRHVRPGGRRMVDPAPLRLDRLAQSGVDDGARLVLVARWAPFRQATRVPFRQVSQLPFDQLPVLAAIGAVARRADYDAQPATAARAEARRVEIAPASRGSR